MTTTRKKFLQQSAYAFLGFCLPANKILSSLFDNSLTANTPLPTIVLWHGSSHGFVVYRAEQDIKGVMRCIVKKQPGNFSEKV